MQFKMVLIRMHYSDGGIIIMHITKVLKIYLKKGGEGQLYNAVTALKS